MSCSETSSCTCGCCSGISVVTPQVETNLPGLPAIAYRTGTWATFRESMLARLSSSDYPALAYLKTRDTDDPSIAMLDASSVVLDILTFYQERLANESYIRTAAQLRSLTELSRLIGYQPAPGVAAATYLAFKLKAAPGLPLDLTTQTITIPTGTQVQSVPSQNQTPQTFETSAEIRAKADWNALAVQPSVPWRAPGASSIYLAGTSTQLNPGDALLILGADRDEWDPSSATPSEQWDVVVLNQVVVDKQNNRTWVAWDQRLDHGSGRGTSPDPSTWSTAKVFAFRQKAALFGNNAPDSNLFTNAWDDTTTSIPELIDDSSRPFQWWNFAIASSDQVDLDASYSKVVVGTWFALVVSSIVQLYKVNSVNPTSRSGYGISAKLTALSADYADPFISDFPLQGTAVLAQSEELTIADQPLDYPLYGSVLTLRDLRPDLVGAKALALFGKAQKLSVNTPASGLFFTPDDGSVSHRLKPGNVVTLIDPKPLPLETSGDIPDWTDSTDASTARYLRVTDAAGRTGTLYAPLTAFSLAASSKNDPDIEEFALVSSVLAASQPYPHTRILLKNPIANCYDRTMTTVNANVGLATAGRSVSEIMGSGSAATPNQSFTLRQSPLTYVQSPTANGRLSTLLIRANGVAWKEVPTLYQQKPSAAVFVSLNQADSTTASFFGDNVEGATLPTGQNNIQATYRIGSGAAGNVAAGSITTLVDRPLGVSGVTNPQSATGGEDAQSITDVRANAPMSVLTLGRAVSITDYENYAATFAGIAKAQALWIPSGPGRGVFLTVAGVNGTALPPGNPTLGYLITSLHNYGNPLIPIYAASFLETLFRVSADISYDPAYDADAVKASIIQTLTQTYSFANRNFGQGVSADEIDGVIQAVSGVVAVNVTHLQVGETSSAGDLSAGSWSVYAYTQWTSHIVTVNRPGSGSHLRICPWIPVADPDALPAPAEILVLDPDPKGVHLGVMA